MNGTGLTSLVQAMAAGQYAMDLSLEAAQKRDPDFAAKAEKAILQHLSRCQGWECPGEDLVDVARALGVQCKDGRAFGSIFKSLIRRGLTACLRSDLPRRKGRGTSGGKLYALTPKGAAVMGLGVA